MYGFSGGSNQSSAAPSRERGEGRAGCVIVLLLAVCFGYIAVSTVPVYLDKIDFEEDLARIASKAGASNWSTEHIRERVVTLATHRDFVVRPDDIKVRRTTPLGAAPEVKLAVRYSRSVEFPGYVYTFSFDCRASSFVGAL